MQFVLVFAGVACSSIFDLVWVDNFVVMHTDFSWSCLVVNILFDMNTQLDNSFTEFSRSCLPIIILFGRSKQLHSSAYWLLNCFNVSVAQWFISQLWYQTCDLLLFDKSIVTEVYNLTHMYFRGFCCWTKCIFMEQSLISAALEINFKATAHFGIYLKRLYLGKCNHNMIAVMWWTIQPITGFRHRISGYEECWKHS